MELSYLAKSDRIINFSKRLKSFDFHLIIVFVFMLLYVFLFSSMSFMQYFSFTYGNELCVQDRHIWKMSQGSIFNGILEYEDSFRAAHFYMIFWVILPLYVILPTPLTLLFLQSLFLATGAVPVYLLAKEKLHSKLAGLAFAICYLLYSGIQNINLYEFHCITLSVSLMLWCFYFVERNEVKKVIVFLILSLLCKETVVFTAILLGVYVLIKNRNEKLGVIIILLSSFWAFFTLFVLFPHTYGGLSYFDAWAFRWGHLGNTGYEILTNFIKNPIYSFSYDISSKIWYLIKLFSPLCFFSILSPGTLLIVMHEFILILSSGKYPMYDINMPYVSSLIPFVFVSAIFGVKYIYSKLRTKYILYVLLFLILMASLISNISFSDTPIISWGEKLGQIVNFRVNDHNMLLFKIIGTIPKNSTLAVDTPLCPQSSHVREVYFLHDYVENSGGSYQNITIDYVLFDDTKKVPETGVEEKLFKFLSDEFVVYNQTDGIFLYKHI